MPADKSKMGTSHSSSLLQTSPMLPLEAAHIPGHSTHDPNNIPQTYMELSCTAFQDKLPQWFFDDI